MFIALAALIVLQLAGEVSVYAIARSATALLLSPGVRDLRECGAKDCSWLFLDVSRTRRRRWCDMQVCGNREKFRRFSARQRAGRS